MIIEFTGQVGSGKSTLAAALRRFLGDRHYTAFSPSDAVRVCLERSKFGRTLSKRMPAAWRRLIFDWFYAHGFRWLYGLRFSLENPKLVWHILRSSPSLQVLPLWHRRVILRSFFEAASRVQFLRDRLRPGEIVIFEEGLIHRAINLYAWNPVPLTREPVMAYFQRLPALDLVIQVKVSPEASLERAKTRGLPSRLRNKDPQVVFQFMENAAQVVELAFEFLSQDHRQAIEVDNQGNLEQGIEDMYQRLAEISPFSSELGDGSQIQPPAHDRNGNSGRVQVFSSKPLLYLPRPDRLYDRIRYQRRSNLDWHQVPGILGEYGLTWTGNGTVPAGPGRSDNLIVETSAGKKMLKRYKSTVDPEGILHEHSILNYLAQVSFPAPHLVNTRNNGTFIEREGRYYALFDFLEGYFQFHDYIFSPAQTRQFIEASARALGTLHAALREFTPEGCNPNGFKSRQGDRWREIAWYIDKLQLYRQEIDQRQTDEAHPQRRGFSRQVDWVEENLLNLDGLLKTAAPPRLVIHGDYGPYNVFFKPDAPITILDFELARLDWRLTDLANAIYFFAIGRVGLRWDRMEHFLTAYQDVSPIDSEELQLLPAVWQFLLMRRAIVCWDRYRETHDRHWLAEADHKLSLARWIENNRMFLSRIE